MCTVDLKVFSCGHSSPKQGARVDFCPYASVAGRQCPDFQTVASANSKQFMDVCMACTGPKAKKEKKRKC